jgi:hypothetical protein
MKKALSQSSISLETQAKMFGAFVQVAQMLIKN